MEKNEGGRGKVFSVASAEPDTFRSEAARFADFNSESRTHTLLNIQRRVLLIDVYFFTESVKVE